MTSKKEIQVIEAADYQLMRTEGLDQINTIVEAMRDDPDAYAIDASILSIIKAPTGGASFVELPNGEPSKSFDCIFLFVHGRRAYFEKSFDESGGSEPPVCVGSQVTVNNPAPNEPSRQWRGFGVGVNASNPNGRCDVCEFAKFSKDDKRPKCREQLQIFMLLPDSTLPVVLQIPVTSIKDAKRFVSSMMIAHRKSYTGYITRVSLVADKNADGIEYQRFAFEFVKTLTDKQSVTAKTLADGFKPLFKNTIIIDGATVDMGNTSTMSEE